ncbi:hypothetical protein [Marimonas lutisalis]|uniref:hypothetical protein n=1 Tax=Marimonas lutisalis TaxID=2545756 RepID=UPI0010F98CEA|nr:hypothetical protein [Marimonas lutisalis]
MKRIGGIQDVMARTLANLQGGMRNVPLRRLAARAEDALDKALAERLDRQLILPCADDPAEELSRGAIQDRGQFLSRQDRWDELSELIRTADAERQATTCAMSHAELYCFGARADVVHATEEALADGVRPSIEGIEAFEELLSEYPDDYPVAVTVALTHADIGWAWRGGDWPHEIPERNIKLFETHFDRAREILAPMVPAHPDSPLVASALCTLLIGDPAPQNRLADDYERLIDLDPRNPRPMRALGYHLLPRWFGSYDALELEARRTAARTGETWGNGAYTWVFMDALSVDPGASRIVDLDFFIDGMRDILANRPDQHFANLMAAYAAIEMDPARLPKDAPDIVRKTRVAVTETLDWILAEYLFELHPLVWAQAAIGPGANTPLPRRSALVRKGVVTARQTIARHFAEELLSGTTVAFSRHGLRLYPSL